MELLEAIAKFKQDLVAVKDGGEAKVEIDRLTKYLDEMAAYASTSTEHRQMEHQSNLAQYNATIAFQVENFKAVIAAGKEAINAAIIINGGAVISLMAFMGNVAAKSEKNFVHLLAFPLLLFGMGVFCGGIAFGTRFISQFLYSAWEKPKSVTAGHWFNAFAWLAVVVSGICFAAGIFVCYHSLGNV
jgi:hypothetical protein